nr:MAG TPA: hypothetical protein [Caudoviricetes sp.]
MKLRITMPITFLSWVFLKKYFGTLIMRFCLV